MYIAFGTRVVDSMDFKNIIEENSDFKVIKDMSKGSKREDIVAFNLSVSIETLNEIISEDNDISTLTEDELFDEYLSLAEELAVEAEEALPDDSIALYASYKWDKSDNDVKVVFAICNVELGENKLKDVLRRLLTQVE
ncbi:MAG: hypothetical protein ACRC7N_05835 [Clostridium sp.]